MNILVTGANGQLGREMRHADKDSGDTYIFADVVPADGLETVILDITDADAVNRAVVENGINCIVNCAAYTDVDKAESDEVLCRRLNADAPKILAEAMEKAGGLLVHISTDYVFGGDPYNTPCREEQKGTPTGVYGAAKLEGEHNIIESGCDYVIIRTAWLYSEYGRNFVRTMLNLTATREQLDVVFDQVGTPTYAGDLALAIFSILEGGLDRGNEGIYHFSDEGVCSWYDFAVEIARATGRNRCRIAPCRTAEYPTKAPRPAYSVLDKSKLKRTFGIEIPHWRESMFYCLKRILSQPNQPTEKP